MGSPWNPLYLFLCFVVICATKFLVPYYVQKEVLKFLYNKKPQVSKYK